MGPQLRRNERETAVGDGSVVSTSLRRYICDSPGLSILTIQNTTEAE